MVVQATSGLGVPVAPASTRRALALSPAELRRARPLLLAAADTLEKISSKAPGSSKPALPPETRAKALGWLRSLAKDDGVVSDLELETLGKKLGHDAARALRETFDALADLKKHGKLAKVWRAESISPEILTRLEEGTLAPTLAKHAQKIARTELFRLFDDPIRDEELHLLLKKELRSRFNTRGADLERLETPVELTLRERGHRQSLASLAALTDPAASPRLKQLLVERLGKIGGQEALPALEALESGAKVDPALSAAATKAIGAIKKALKMTIVLAAMEAKPYCGTGGLGNVMAELPKALAKMGHRVIVLVPRHAVINRDKLEDTGKSGVVYGPDGTEKFKLLKDHKDGVDYYFIENDRYFSKLRAGLYGDQHGDYKDNVQRYDFFGASIPTAIRTILGSEAPDVVQLNDAHTASAAVYLRRDPAFEKTKTIMAVHNLGGAYQGKFDSHNLHHLRFNGLGLFFPAGPAEFHGQVNLMKLGLVESHASITVSRQYMKEILTEEQGEGLHGVLRVLDARGRLWGNLNGIDTSTWSSETDPLIPHHFSIDDRSGKAACKSDLQKQLGLDQSANTPLVGVVARLTNQKGFDDILASITHAMESGKDVQFVVLGQGDPALAKQLRELAEKYPGKVAFDEAFTVAKEHLIYAGSDFFLMPSKFEPCGLPQMYALRYLTVPIVRAVGGLEESIEDHDEEKNRGTGFKFEKDLDGCLGRALAWYAQGDEHRDPMLRRCAAADFSWETTSAPEQLAFYRKIINR